MTQIITAEQARKITGGRKPLVPVEYEDAIKALAICITLDETKYWSDKADALAAWAKIYRDDKTLRQAKQLKLHAFRRMGQLAAELRPKKGGGVGGGAPPGAVDLLIKQGLKKYEATAARVFARLDDKAFEQIVTSPRPSSPAIEAQRVRERNYMSEAWMSLARATDGLAGFRSFCRRHEPVALAKALKPDEAKAAEVMVDEVSGWLDKFINAIEKRHIRESPSSPTSRALPHEKAAQP